MLDPSSAPLSLSLLLASPVLRMISRFVWFRFGSFGFFSFVSPIPVLFLFKVWAHSLAEGLWKVLPFS